MKTTWAAFTAAMLVSTTAIAQETLPFQVQNPDQAITTPQGRATTDSMLSTKPQAAEPLPWQRPQVTAPGTKAMPAQIPFGRSTASQYQPIPEGPHTATAVPVENVDAIESTELPPAAPAPLEADPANENPAEPTELNAPIFKAEENAPPRTAVVRVLNKVTARAQTIEIAPGDTEKVGKLEVKVSHCQRSSPESLPDAAALFQIAEIVPNAEKPKQLFSGWMYQSSPSVSALEHPVYDVMLMQCKAIEKPSEPKDKPKKSAKKSKKS